MRRVGVIGTFVWDTIYHPDRTEGPLEQWGGVAYSLSAFAATCPPGWAVVPIVRVGADLAEEAVRFLERLGIEPRGAGFRVVDEPTDRVELRYRSRSERFETMTGGISPWSAAELLPIIGTLDALYVNYLCGFEMDLGTATQVRRASAFPIHADLHSLFLAEPSSGPRLSRMLPAAGEWMRSADIIQVNEDEHRLLRSSLPQGTNGDPLRAILGGAEPPHALLVTAGYRGASCHGACELRFEEVDGQVTVFAGSPGYGQLDVPLEAGPTSGDPTGCGDVWGATVFCGLLAGLNLREAMGRAHRAAAARLREPTVETLSGAIGAALDQEARNPRPR